MFEEFWAAAEQAGRPVLVHPAFNEPNPALEPYYFQNVIGNPLETTVMVERMICAGVFALHPGLRLVVLHGGGYLPYQAGRLAHACRVRPEIPVQASDVWEAFGQLYFDTITHDTAPCATWLSASAPITCCSAPTCRSTWRSRSRPWCWPKRSRVLNAASSGAANAARLFGLEGMRGG